MSTHNAVIVDTARSPRARLRPVAVDAVRLTDGFWAPRLAALREVTLPTQHALMEETGRINNFRRAAGKVDGDFEGIYFNDSDVYKWLEAVAWAVAYEPDARLTSLMGAVIAEIAPAQREDGYLNTYYTFDRAGERWTNLADMHELYLAGHLFQAAVAHRRATGRDDLLAIARRFADHIDSIFGPGKRHGAAGHPEIEMALVELFRETGEPRYLDLGRFLLDERGGGHAGGRDYNQDHVAFGELREVVGHAVRALYLNCGGADVVLETGDPALTKALDALWSNLTSRRMYVTGGVGARHAGEAFGGDYELPNSIAYAETCAAIASAMWQWRMFLATADARYMDVFELALLNGVLAGLSLDGRQYFYVNPLADRGGRRRESWFGCACCPPNIARVLAQVSGYLYALSSDGIWINLYAAGEATVPFGGATVRLAQETAYPWDGGVLLRVDPPEEMDFTLRLRVPEWAEGASASINGQSAVDARPGSYLALRRTWHAGDTVTLDLPMPPRWLAAHPRVEADTGRGALRRGPLVYAVEAADNPGLDPWDLAVLPDEPLALGAAADLPIGTTAILGRGVVVSPEAWGNRLYLPAAEAPAPGAPVGFTAIPYYAWANRAAGPMQVWVQRRGT